MKKAAAIGAGIVCLSLMFSSVYANEVSTSSGILLKTLTQVRAEGMGGAQSGVQTDEAGAVGWNPAGLYGNRYPGVSAVYFRGMADDNFGALNFEMPLGANLVCGAGLMFYDAGAFELNDSSGETSTVAAQRDFLAVLTGAYHLTAFHTGITMGANLKVLQSTLLEEYSAFAAAVDLGVRVNWGGVLKPFQIGLAVKNLGTPMKYVDSADSLPAYALVGLGYDVFQDKIVGVLLAGDAQFDLASNWRGSLGTEVRLYDWIALRGGYKLGYDTNSFTLGFGFHFENFQLDYAFSPMQTFDSLHSASLKYTFGPVSSAKVVQEEDASASEPTYQVGEVEKKPDVPVEKVPAEIVEIQRAGGRVSNVIMNIGSEQGIKIGFNGVIVDTAGRPLATIVVRQVDPNLSLAEVVGLGRDIGNNASAVIEKPVAK